jgi:predicted metal-binding membrane protein
MERTSPIEAALRRDRLIVAAGLLLVTVAAWFWTLAGAGMRMPAEGGMAGMGEAMRSATTAVAPWSPAHAVLMALMWWVMMVAMMVPSATPLVLLFAAVQRRRRPGERPYPTVGLLVAGYLAVWGLFGLAATLLQWWLERSSLLSPATMAVGPVLAGLILLAAGLYQLTPLKQACLRHCRAPLAFVTAHWRPGAAGAWRMGALHGAWCLGCCWFLMGLLFVGGIMNPLWIGGVALYILFEKLMPHGHWLRRASGLALAGAGVAVLARAAF